MIRIDEIYHHTFWTYIKKHLPSTCMYHCDPPGRTDPESILNYELTGHEKNFVFFFDQEPMIPELHKSTFNEINQRNYLPGLIRKKGAVVVNEFDSDNIDYICNQYNLQPFRYFFHGWAALDWFRGYDKTFLITPPAQRTINKTFFSPNRIIGGMRQHRVLMLYHFQRLGMMDNWISASKICPVEHTSIETIALEYQQQYPDIVDTINQISLPKLFPGEDQTLMTSCWLDNFDLCAETLVYHISETIFTGRRQYLTEKTFKPIAMGMPFVITGTAGSLAFLRRYGFKTFEGVWDESYDQETNDILRAERIASLLKSLDELPQDGKQDLFKMALPIIKHNWNHFYNGGFESVLWKELTTMLDSVGKFLTND